MYHIFQASLMISKITAAQVSNCFQLWY